MSVHSISAIAPADRVESYDATGLRRFANAHAGQRCFVIGNGPSLNRTDLWPLRNEITFGFNGIYHLTRSCGFAPTYYLVEDNHVIEDNLDEIRSATSEHCFFPSRYQDVLDGRPDTANFFRTDWQFYWRNTPHYGNPRFSHDVSDVIYVGQTVTYLSLQLAAYMGFSEIHLIGMDFDYDVPVDVEVDGYSITSDGADANHFHPDYFGPGKKWHLPQLDRVALNYTNARKEIEGLGRTITNATVGGKLEIFDRMDFGSLVAAERGDQLNTAERFGRRAVESRSDGWNAVVASTLDELTTIDSGRRFFFTSDGRVLGNDLESVVSVLREGSQRGGIAVLSRGQIEIVGPDDDASWIVPDICRRDFSRSTFARGAVPWITIERQLDPSSSTTWAHLRSELCEAAIRRIVTTAVRSGGTVVLTDSMVIVRGAAAATPWRRKEMMT